MDNEDQNYFLRLEAIHPKLLANILIEKRQPKGFKGWILKNEIRPVDIYCYLYAKYGPPNGFMNFLRNDSSDNLIHWEWTLVNDDGMVMIQGHNYRTEVQFLGNFERPEITKSNLIAQIKGDLRNYGKRMTAIRTQLEKWIEFVNPFESIESTIEIQIKKLRELNLSPADDKVHTPTSHEEMQTYQQRFSAMAEKYTFGTGLAFGLRCMLPVLAETFIHLLIFTLSTKELRNDETKYREFVSDTISNHLQLLHANCQGFEQPVDHSHIACRNFYQLMNDRNDLLHGNFNINKLKTGEVYFYGKVPIMYEYGDMWQNTLGTRIESVKLEHIESNHSRVKDFIAYLISLLEPKFREQIEIIMSVRDLGYNEKLNRLGVLFSPRATEGFMFFESEFLKAETQPSK
ncbi:hypothetical protein SAMN05660489_02375 [Pseudomonas sp. LAMO17WK12:I10]|uniref:hypothetical protein n=1 Tax=unclassified Pseudomonas TaxID=196821 RepID=UPI000BCA8E2F|nr:MULTISPECIES: hypothetical protein [unclassified Pseudomonas]PXX73120.1 hypothetical protein H160_02460 [Pseudomonas sp. LAMO17WK12:I9]SNY28565.1 hypothetical protein SAMN05660489_02375 [Pseudomonas sp. LAMO17WK12:I10]